MTQESGGWILLISNPRLALRSKEGSGMEAVMAVDMELLKIMRNPTKLFSVGG